jgi:uncharacterized membrane protein
VTAAGLFIAVFLACAVEAVEAATIVLAAGTTRDWRSALSGVGAGLVVLAAVVAGLGPALTAVPIDGLRLVVGALLLVFGVQWLRKAILRASGHKALHDEDEIFRRQVSEAGGAPSGSRGLVADWWAFTISFKGVVLEGLEVAFIALTFGSNDRHVGLAAVAAFAAVIAVAAAAATLRAPLARVPENTMKFVVGVMLVSFGSFWGAEGVAVDWPGSDAALLVLVPGYALFALALASYLRSRRRPSPTGGKCADGSPDSAEPAVVPDRRGPLRRRTGTAGAFVVDFLVGDDWTVAAVVAAALGATWLMEQGPGSGWWLLPAAVSAALASSVLREVGRTARGGSGAFADPVDVEVDGGIVL